jgi:cobalt-zinc-cadmium efflux system outer membrane protein
MRGSTFPLVMIATLILGAVAPRPVVAGHPEAGEPNGVLTLREATALALARNPELGVFPDDLRAADALVLQAGLWPNPQLAIEVEDVGGRRERSGFEAAQTTVQIGQPIECGASGRAGVRDDTGGSGTSGPDRPAA